MSEREKSRREDEIPARDEAARLERGALIDGRYRVLGRLGSGAMGTVYEVEDEHLQERIALKLLHAHLSADRNFRSQLRDEVRLARRVSHPNVCRVHDLGQTEQLLFVTMELVRGESLRTLLRSDALPPLQRKLDILIQLCSALAAAHRAGVLHRDIKPDNVLLAGDRAVLTDFGVASLVGSGVGRSLVGTAAYMAPEVVLGSSPDIRVDVYSTAVLAYELLSGSLPFAIADVSQRVAAAKQPEAYPGLRRGCAPPAVAEALDSVLARALSHEPAERPSDIDKLAEALSRASRGELAAVGRIARGTVESPARDTETDSRRARITTALQFAAARGAADTDIFERIIGDWGGHLLASDANSVRAIFGAPISQGDDAHRAARAALDLIERFGGSAAIDTQRVSFTVAIDGTLSDVEDAYDDLDALLGEAGQLGCSASSARHIAGHFHAVAMGATHSGRPKFVVSPRRGGAYLRSAALVGRDVELGALLASVRPAFSQRRPSVVEIVGDAGSGKTRLHLELARRLSSQREVDWLIGHGAPVASAAPLLVLRSADRGWYRAARAAPAGDARAASAAARAWLLRRAARRPVAFIIDDAHWADESTLEFVRDLVGSLRHAPIAVVLATRKKMLADAPTIRLGPLVHPDAAQLARRLGPDLAPRAVRAIAERSGGNPLFISELVHHALLDGSAEMVPDTVEGAIQGRADRLSLQSRAILELAAVIGSEFPLSWLRGVRGGTPASAATLEGEVTALTMAGLLIANGDGESYRFASPVVREVVAAQIDPRIRALLHTRAARFLESLPSEQSGRDAALGHHWHAANEPVKARSAYRRAGRHALEMFADRDALASLEFAEQLTPEDERDAELLELVGDALVHRDAKAASARYRSALALLATEPAEERAILFEKLATTSAALADNAGAVRYLEQGLELASRGGVSDETRAKLLAQLGWVLGYTLGDNVRGLRCGEEAVALLEDSGDKLGLSRALGRLGANYMRAGRWRDQLECNRRNLAIARELGDVRGLLASNVNLGVTYTSLGEIDQALEHTFAALEISTREGYVRVEPVVRSNLGALLLEKGDLDAAEAQVDAAIELASEVGQLYMVAEACCTLARLAFVRGDLGGAEMHARHALQSARDSGSRIDVGIALRHTAAIVGKKGRREEAVRLFAESLEALEASDPYEHARTQVAQGRFWRASSESSDWQRGDALLAEAKVTLERLGAARDLSGLERSDDLR